MNSSLKELRELSRNVELKKKEFQKHQSGLKLKEQLQLHSDAIKNKTRIQENLGSSKHIHFEAMISRIRFDYLAMFILFSIVTLEIFYFAESGLITNPFQKRKYEVSVSTDQARNSNIAEVVNKLMDEVKAKKNNPAFSNLFNTKNSEKINSFVNQTESLNIMSIVYARNEDCYYASALTDKDRNITLKLKQLEGDYKVSAIDIED